ncbi:Hsp20/alpha crystallin family protein [Candidatus Chrysopegis kryptomonas]|jgi:HSP20 family molecular chaperone IbpA|uniref:Molecular chaperone IbpA, HSP20 family n=1 Tax=Candidatus Chryseopegocella kryptomonas TaxID=1633643 RepID=A0A0P1MPJ3_9BACT|nr:Hsp20/alpha crystallin family protein [Candidatus Chrysopegis kryptomonas]CUS97541.1 Molecular chaperone IbpA, HSP20 family [Candidatus Chrysopegis kryptomonas]
MRRDRSIIKNEKSLRTYITPPADLYETPDAYILYIDLPGVTKENLNIKVVDNSLIVQGKFELSLPKDSDTMFSELAKGEYRREFVLAGDVDRNKIDAKLVNGVLILTLGKKEESKEIEIKIE